MARYPQFYYNVKKNDFIYKLINIMLITLESEYRLNSTKVLCLFDTDSNVNLISESLIKKQ